MKKIITTIAAAAIAVSASAQEPKTGFSSNNFLDNWSLGVNGGIGSKTTHQAVLNNINPNIGLRLTKWFHPAFGLSVEGNYYLTNKIGCLDRFVYDGNYSEYPDGKYTKNGSLHLNLLGQVNLSNAFCGYNGTPRNFEVIAIAGTGWGGNYGGDDEHPTLGGMWNAKFGFDFAYNFGSQKEWQLYVEPAIIYAMGAQHYSDIEEDTHNFVQLNINKSILQLNLGINYFFKTSNGTHRFANVTECDQREIDALNATINSLRDKDAANQAKIAQLQAEIDRLQKALRDCQARPTAVTAETPVLPSVFYNVNKSLITKQQAENVAVAAQVLKNHPEMKLQVKGYASPEGPSKLNNKLSQRRANAVKDMLVKKYGIAEDRITTEGCGETKDMFKDYSNNRVAMMFVED